jgi:ubiquinone/menaquinone biosynthesis C-methylase UbiE
MPTLSTHAFAPSPRTIRRRTPIAKGGVASAYDHVGDEYGSYADGEGLDDPSAGETNRFAHADAIVWKTVRSTIEHLQSAGVHTLRVLDAGCGPGTWVKRTAAYAHRLGLEFEAVGIDISKGQLEIARKQIEKPEARHATGRQSIEFLVHDLADPLPWDDGHFHIVLCNYVVLNHLSKSALPRAVGELCRVSAHRVIATVRALGSPPTGCIIGTEQVREYHQDCGRGELRLVLKDGTEHRLTFNLYSAEMLKAVFAPHVSIVDLRAIDVFLSRFAADANWTAKLVTGLPGRQEVLRKLEEIEEPLCRLPGWVDHGTHILIVAQPNRATTSARR